jgi:hypothetical protein
MMRSFFAVAFLIGCGGGSGGPDLLREDIPDPPAGGVQVVSPIFEVPAESEVFMCMRIYTDITEELNVHASVGYQVEGGHHVMLYYSEEEQEGGDEPHDCGGGDMGNIRFVGVGTADGIGISLPDGVAMKIPPGVKLYSQSHYVNTSAAPMQAQDVVNLEVLAPEAVEQTAGAFTEVDLTLELEPGVASDGVVDCTAPMDMTIPWMIPHMHEKGTHFKLEVIRGEETVAVYDEDWDPSFRDHFPVVEFEPHLQLTTADRIRTTCSWFNDTGETMYWPAEMCATFMSFYPSPDGALLACDSQGNHFQP